MLPLLVLLGTIAGAWYLLIVRPQHQQQTRHGALVSQLQIGNHVLTVGGIFGRVVAINGSMVDVELSGPGSVTRIATDAIARIVPGGPELPAQTANADARPPVTNMQQHPHEQTAPPAPQPTPSGFVAPPLPTFSQPTYAASQPQAFAAPPQAQFQHQTQPQLQPQPQPFAAPQYAQPVQPMPAHGQTTLRAQVVEVAPLPPAPILTPWSDVAPRQPVSAPVHAQHAPAAPGAAPVSPGFQLAHQQVAAPSMGAPAAYPPQQVAPGQFAAPVPHAAPQYAAPVHAQVAAPQPQYAPVPAHAVPVEQPVAANDGRRRSKAPEGMGSSLRLDDPSLVETMARARNERAGLADEYRRVVAPLVDISDAPAPQQQQQHAYQHQQVAPVQHGHAPAAPGGLFAQPPAGMPVGQPPAAMPRPHVPAPEGQIDPAFQRRTPMAHSVAPQQHPFAEAPAPALAPTVPA